MLYMLKKYKKPKLIILNFKIIKKNLKSYKN